MKNCVACGAKIKDEFIFCSKECLDNWREENKEELMEDCWEKDRHSWDVLPPGEPCSFCGYIRHHNKIGF